MSIFFWITTVGWVRAGAVLVVNMTKIRQFFTQNTVMSLTMCCCHWSDLRPILSSIELVFYVAMYIT